MTMAESMAHLPAVFVESEWNASDRWLIVPGLRFDYASTMGASFFTMDPRLTTRLGLRNDIVLKAGIGLFRARQAACE